MARAKAYRYVSIVRRLRRHGTEHGRALQIVRKFFPKVSTVVDARRDAAIEVTKRDVTASKRRAHDECAMALACQRALHLDGVIMAIGTAYLVKGRKAVRYLVPMPVQREIVAFDRGGGFEPGEYRLKKPDKWHALGHPGGHTRDAEPRSAKLPEPRHATAGIRTVLSTRT